jgi:hypothetical protein
MNEENLNTTVIDEYLLECLPSKIHTIIFKSHILLGSIHDKNYTQKYLTFKRSQPRW